MRHESPVTDFVWARSDRYTAGGNKRSHIVVHNTANTATARQEALNLRNNPGQSSFHYVLDGADVIQCVHDYDTAWAVGAWAGSKTIVGNSDSISIEVCSPGTEFTETERVQLRALVLHLMEYYDIPADRVVRHYDCHTGHKLCPAAYSGVNGARWAELHAYVTGMAHEEDGNVRETKNGVYRLYNPNSGLHMQTASHAEASQLERAGWSFEGCTLTTRSGVPVYRLYSKGDGNHLLTPSVYEVGALVVAGWEYEGIAWQSDERGDTEVHRAYNPNNGDHLLLAPGEELDSLVAEGWRDEGAQFAG